MDVFKELKSIEADYMEKKNEIIKDLNQGQNLDDSEGFKVTPGMSFEEFDKFMSDSNKHLVIG